jgi:GT2 family glycosyltransferase/glycosyltransferase involved in cell wall biosynthesis/ubiquinone/menaquinone biosynthesis C-methylase UbiE/Flp pilus assembly protein TadD
VKLEDFKYDDTSGLYLGKESGTPAGYMDGAESYLGKILSHSTDLGLFSTELKSAVIDWPSMYHLSPYRATILDCFDFRNHNSRVLELGAGCGAVTRWLGENFQDVCSVEGNFHRAHVARLRCRDMINVKVYTSNFLDLEINNSFDITTLIGVLEYSHLYHPLYNNSPEKAALSTLQLVYNALKSMGVLVLAIENKFGLKYFSGAKEDHSGRHFDSIQGYPRNDSAVTYSASEIRQLLLEAGFSSVEFFMPFPDYKLATSIISAQELSPDYNLHNWIETPFPDRCAGQRSLLYNESLVIRELAKSNMLRDLTNSFLVMAYKSDKGDVCRKLGLADQNWVAKHYSLGRHSAFCKKVSLVKRSENSLEVMNDPVVNMSVGRKTADSMFHHTLASEPFYNGDQLLYKVFEILTLDDYENRFSQLIESLIKCLLKKYSVGRNDSFGIPLVRGESFDAMFWNVIVESESEEWKIIDKEWSFNGILPVDFIIWRNLYHLILRHNTYFKEPLNEQSMVTFIIDNIRQFYPSFNRDRYDSAKKMEDYFHDFVSNGTDPDVTVLPLGESKMPLDNQACSQGGQNEKRKVVSIIIPVFNNVEFTQQCLEALAANTQYEPYEVIIVDNGSTDGTGELFKCLAGEIKIITNDQNRGFAKACNQGARAAQGDYLVFLNNDTVPQPGWLEGLVSVVREQPDVAIVGSKLLYQDNTVQHAGVVFNVRGTGIFIYHIYKGFDREAPVVNRVREFNAVTAACMLIREDVFTESGMFDETFINGYEDVDLCLKVRDKGYRIIYNPESELYHYEEQTEGRFSHGEHNTNHLLNRWGKKIKTDDQTIAVDDGYRIEFLADNSMVYHRIEEVFDKAGVNKDEYFQQERLDVMSVVPDDAKRILDVGCGEGILGRGLLTKGVREVTGIEVNPGVCEKAKKNLTHVIQGNIEEMEISFPERYFDCIIFADILEHLKDPLSTLKELKNKLSDSGVVVASIPNVQYHGVLNMLAKGEWKYGNSGILDRTHLRFFTKKEIKTLFADAGFEITGMTVNIDTAYDNVKDLNLSEITFANMTIKGLMPDEIEDLFVFQYIVRARKVMPELTEIDGNVQRALDSGNFEEAKQKIESHLELHSVDMNMLYKHAEICLELGDKESAGESLQKILIFYPEREDALKLMQNIKGNGKAGNGKGTPAQLNKGENTEMGINRVKKVAVVRGASLNKWEMQNYEPLADSYDITAYTTTQGYFDTEKIKLPIVKLPFHSQGLLLHMEGLEDKLASSDLVYSADITYEFSAQAVKAKEKYGCKVVCLEWENIPFNHEEHDVIRRIKNIVRFGADHFIAVTERAKEALLIEGIAENKIDVVPMGIDLDRFSPSDEDNSDYRAQLGIEKGERVILFIGRMVWEKGVYDLVHAAGKILRETALITEPVRFLMAGSGPELEALRERAERLGISDNIIFQENTPYHEIHKLHNIADIFVLPSISTQNWQEQFGMVLIESMACGKAVISTRSGSISEVVADAGILVQPNDHLSLYNAIKKLMCNKELRDTLGSKALLRAREEFDSKRTAEKVKEVFEKVLSRKSVRDEINEFCDQGMKCLEQGNKEKAFELICNAFQQDPDNKTVLDILVRTGMEINKLDMVEKSLREYLIYHPANIESLASLAEALIEQGKMSEAEGELQKVLIFERDNKKAASLMDKMKAEL